ncbi:MAG: hypothetical protein APF80_01115 [Alphaproteobacteria bacterium BRH_c36]|nr:MAG: hypothetical protein APF80_01115 [Alphaproteobacteria bacterium BRH_c36]
MGQILPLAILVLFTAVAGAPWWGSSEMSAALIAAFLPAAAIHYWAVRRASVIPEVAVLFSGLAVDIVSGGPLGLWVLVYAAAFVLGLVQRPWVEVFWKPGRWVLFALAMPVLGLLVYGVGFYSGRAVASGSALLHATAWLIVAYPAIAVVLRLADGWRAGRPLERA